jgi:hypothetical protein
MSNVKLFFIYVGVVILMVGLGFWLFKSSENNQANLPGQGFELQGAEHITEGSTDHIPYNSNPPTSGPHWPQPADWGVYRGSLPDERLVHNLEHGGIWISYKPDQVDENTINLLNDFAKRYPLIIVEPRSANETPIALAAWGRLQNLQSYDESAILRFIEAFHNQGPEKVM